MKKSDWQYLVDSLLFICIVGIAFIGILLGLFIPKGPSAPESTKYFLNLHRHQWGNIHFYLSIGFVILVIVHLALSWKWIKGRASQIFKKAWKTALVSTVILSILVLFLFWVFYPKDPGAYQEYGVRSGRTGQYSKGKDKTLNQSQEYVTINGKLTLKDIEKVTGLPTHRILEALGLPANVSEKETLGRLSKKHGFTLEEVRDIVIQLLNQQRFFLEQKPPGQEVRQEKLEEKPIGQTRKQEPQEKQKPTQAYSTEGQTGIVISGQMNLMDIEKQTGLSAREIADKLGLPQNAPLDETLGRLSRRYSITLQDVRNALSNLLNKETLILEEHSEDQALTKGRMAEDQTGILITGQMSLYEVEKLTGIPAKKIIQEMDLPETVPRGENLGRLRRRYGFTLQEVRDAVASLMKKK